MFKGKIKRKGVLIGAVTAFAVLAGASALIPIMNTRAEAYTSVDENWEFTVTASTVRIDNYVGTDTDVYIPTELTYISDKDIDGNGELDDEVTVTVTNYAQIFMDNKSIKSVTIPEGVTDVTASLFHGCTSLETVNLPDSIVSISDKAFRDCTSLTSVNLPKALKTIKPYAFYNCTKLKSIDLPEGLDTIEERTFYKCTSLDGVVIPDTVVKIGDYAFYNCTSLTAIDIPESVTRIGSSAFNGCTRLADLTLHDGLTEISVDAFRDCSSVKELYIPSTLVKIGTSAFNGIGVKKLTLNHDIEGNFSGMTSLQSVVLEDGITIVTNGMFSGCSSLKSVEIPETVIRINDNAFGGTALKEIYVPTSVEYIGQGALPSASITKATIGAKEIARNCCYHNGSGGTLTSLTLLEGVEKIGEDAFGYQPIKGDLVLPDSLTELGDGAFYKTSITTLTFGKNLKSTGKKTFAQCGNLIKINFSEGLEEIGEQAFGYAYPFMGDPITGKIVFPSTLKYIRYKAFYSC